ncbi:MAG: branched-chain amino acid ABC transporter permease, partial [Nitrobacter sp.]
MTALTDAPIRTAKSRVIGDEMIVFILMTGLLAIVPLTGIYPYFVMQGLCFALLACAFNLLV